MINLLTSWPVFDIITCFDVMTNILKLWRMLWRYDVLKLSWQHKHGHNQMHTNISEWWCGQTVGYVSRVSKGIHTTIISLGLFWNYFGHHRDAWFFVQNPVPPPSGMLANKHVLYLSLKITPFRAISNTLLHIFVVYLLYYDMLPEMNLVCVQSPPVDQAAVTDEEVRWYTLTPGIWVLNAISLYPSLYRITVNV